MKYIINFLINCTLLLSACKRDRSDNAIEIAGFQQTVNLSGDRGHELLGFMTAIGLTDSLLIVNTADQPFIHFYDTSGFKEISNFGVKGKGPNEFIYLNFYNDFSKTGSEMWLLDPNKRQLLEYPVRDLVSKSEFITPLKEIRMPDTTAMETGIANISDTLIIGGCYSKNGQLFFYNPVKRSIRWSPYSPVIQHEGESEELGQLYFGIVRKKPDCTRVVCALRYFKRIIITDVKSNKSIVLKTNQPEQYMPKADINLDYLAALNFIYLDLCCMDKYFYALYLDVNSKQLYHDGFPVSQIQVFDYSGNPVIQMNTDRPINNIAVDEENGIIFGSNTFQEGMVYKFNLPKEITGR